MFRLRKREDYFNPRTTVTQVDLEGIICNSIQFNVEAKESQNYNLEEFEGEGTGSDTWLE